MSTLLEFATAEQARLTRDIDDLTNLRREVHEAMVNSDYRLSAEEFTAIRAKYPLILKTPAELRDELILLNSVTADQV